jgi:folate-binding protein YgfZ
MQTTLLSDRGVVKVAGSEARRFLHGIVTSDVEGLSPGQSRYAALLTPQGKVIADFMIAEAADGGGFFIDCPRALVAALTEKLVFYRLRAKLTIEDLSDRLGVMAAWDGSGTTECGLLYPDPRLPALGLRCILPPDLAAEATAELGATLADAPAYEAYRIALGVPRGGVDFAYGDVFPHDVDMDQLGGIDFAKGCYIGQEVVSRMEHRGSARSRIVAVIYDEFAPEAGMPVMAGDKIIGVLGSTAQRRGLAMLRLDRLEDALAAATPITAGGIPLRVTKPAWARFAFPGEATAAE